MAEKDFKGYRSPFGSSKKAPIPEEAPIVGRNEFIQKEDKLNENFRSPSGARDMPAPEYEETQDQKDDAYLADESPPALINYFGQNFYKGSKEEKKKIAERAVASETPKTPPKEEESSDEVKALESQGGLPEAGKKKNIEKYGEEYSGWSEAANGFKASYGDVWRSLKQGYGYLSGDDELFKKVQDETRETDATYDSVPGKVGYFLGSASQMLIPFLGEAGLAAKGAQGVGAASKLARIAKFFNPETIGKMAAFSGVQNMLSPTTGGSEDFLLEKGKQGVIGAGAGALGGVIGEAVGSAIKPLKKMIGGKTAQEFVKEAERLGIPLTLPDVVDNKTVQMIKKGAEILPGSAEEVSANALAKQKSLQKLAVKTIDAADTTSVAPTEEFMRKNWDSAKAAYQDLRSIPSIELDKTFKDEVKDLYKKAVDVKTSDPLIKEKLAPYLKSLVKEVEIPQDKGLMKLAEEMNNAAEKTTNSALKKGYQETAKDFEKMAAAQKVMKELDSATITGDSFVSSANNLRDIARNASGDTQHYIRSLADSLESTAERNIQDPVMLEKLQQSRLKMARISRVADSISNTTTGEISPDKLYTQFVGKQPFKRSIKAEQAFAPDLKSAAEIFKNIPKFSQGISPTAEKLQAAELVAGIGSLPVNPGLSAALATKYGLAKYGTKGLLSKTVLKRLLEGSPELKGLLPLLQKSGQVSSSAAKTLSK